MNFHEFLEQCSIEFQLHIQGTAAISYMRTNSSHTADQPIDDWIWALTMGGEIENQ